MIAALSIWENRIAPVFDTARELAVAAPPRRGSAPVRISLADNAPGTILAAMRQHRAEVLICGAISRPLRDALADQGLAVYAFVTGELPEVLCAWRDGRLDEDRFRMPGCRASPAPGRRQRRRRRGEGQGGADLPYGAPLFPAEREVCQCPRCGYRTTRIPGRPCSQCRCPECRAPMVRAQLQQSGGYHAR